MVSEKIFNGESLTDITSFILLQNTIDHPKKVNFSQIKNLDSIIRTIFFYDSTWVLSPTTFGYDIQSPYPDCLNQLIKERIIKVHNPKFCENLKDFKDIFYEMINFILPDTLDTYLLKNEAITSDLLRYENFFKFTTQSSAKELAKQVGITNQSLIPIAANLIRANIYAKSQHEIESQNNSEIVYAPNFIRVPFTDKILKSYENKTKPIIDSIINELTKIVEIEKEELNKYNNTRFEMEIPILTLYVLKKCDKPQDILDVIFDMRTDNNIMSMRNWWRKYQNELISPEADPEVINECSRQWGNLFRNIKEKSKINMRYGPDIDFSIGLSGGASIGVTKPCVDLLTWYKTRDIIFLSDLKDRMDTILYSKKEIERIFGISIKNSSFYE